MSPVPFHHGPDLRSTVFSPTPPYTSSSAIPTPDSWTTSPALLPSAPHPSHAYATSISLASPTNVARHNGLAPVAVAASVIGAPTPSDRLPFKAVKAPHDPVLASLDGKVTQALEPVALIHAHLTAANSALSNFLTHSTALNSALHALSPSASLQQCVAYHHSVLHGLTAASSFYSIDVLYPLSDWVDDASQLSIELGHTQQTRHQLSAATDELDNLLKLKAEDVVPPSVDELISDRREKVEKQSGLYAGQVEGVERSVRKVLEGRERMVEMVARNWREWEWKVMRRWSKLAEVLGKADNEVDAEGSEEEEEEEQDEKAADEQDADEVDEEEDSTGYNRQLLSPELSTHARSIARKADTLNEQAEEEWQTELEPHSDSDVDDDEDDADSFVSANSLTSNGLISPPFSPSAASTSPQPPPNFPYKPAACPSVPLTPLPWRPLPAGGLAQSVWLSLFGSAYKWDEARDELVCQFEVRAGEGKEEVERVFRRRKRRSRRDVDAVGEDREAEAERRPAQLTRLLSERREEEVEAAMRRVGMSAQEVAAAILAVDLDKLTADKVSLLVVVLPTEAELASLLGSLSSSPSPSAALLSSLSPASLLLTSLIAPMQPSLITCLQCLHHYYQLPTLASSLLSSLALLLESATQLRDSTLFHHTLAAILELFNYLHPRQVSYAFDIRLLASLSNLAATPASPSFLAFLVAHLASHHSQLLSFPASLPSLHRAAQLSAAALQSQLDQLSSSVSEFRAMLDALDASSESEAAAARQRWVRLFDQLLDTQDKVEKRRAAAAAKCDDLCAFLCYQQPAADTPAAQPLPTAADYFALLQLLDAFVSDLNGARSREERKRTRRERFRVNVKEEKAKEAAEAEEKRRQRAAQHLSVRDGRQRSSNDVPRGGSIFSELHERHSPPAIERMTRNPSISPADRPNPVTSEPTPTAKPATRTPAFSIRSATTPSGSTAQSSPALQTSSPQQLSAPGSRRDSTTSRAVGSRRASGSVSGRGSVSADGSDVQTVVYRDDDDENARRTPVAGVKMTRLPFQSHFTYTP